MIIYRAMCQEEFEKTILYNKPHFIKRYKWFSPDLNFILGRVKDGNFNNSLYNKHKYEFICSFEWDGLNSDWKNNTEIQFDRRKNPKLMLVDIVNIIQEGV